MLKRITLFSIFTLFSFVGFAQTYVLSGQVTGKKNAPLPFITIFVKGTDNTGKAVANGTNSNATGAYSFKLAAGKYTVTFQSIGYKKTSQEVTLDKNTTLNMRLEEENYEMKAVSINAGEDPAYAIIRKAQANRKTYNGQPDAFTCKVYIKGLQRLRSIPENLLKIAKLSVNGFEMDSSLFGVVYLSESETQFNFKRPDYIKEVMFSSKVSGDNKAFSYNQASDVLINFYDNKVELGGLSDRPFISPIAENAMFYYKYRLIGSFTEDGVLVHKIKVIPKRKQDPVFSGYIFIQEGSFRIHTTDLLLGKDAKIDFVDTLQIRQVFAPVNDSVWMQFSLNLNFVFKAFGIVGDGYFNSVFDEYKLNPEFPKKYFKGEVLKVEDDANKKDSSYWEQNRPIPLTQEEIDDYKKKDSLSRIRNSKSYLDSIDKRSNKFRWKSVLLGYTYYNRSKNTTWNTDGIFRKVMYNTVEGLVVGLGASYNKTNNELNTFKRYSVNGRYGFGNKLLSGTANATWFINQPKDQLITAWAGREVRQISGFEQISPLLNAAYTLIDQQNFMKLMYRDGFGASYRQEVINGLTITAKTDFAKYSPLVNTTFYTWAKNNRVFTSNNPQDPSNDVTAFSPFTAWETELNIGIRFKQQYYSRPHEKVRLSSKYPKINIVGRVAVPVGANSANYFYAGIFVRDRLNLKLFGQSEWVINAGKFITAKNLPFAMYRHFQGNQTLYSANQAESFRLLPYYTYSTNNYFIAAHFEHDFNRFIINKLPILRKLSWKEVAGVHFLKTDALRQYVEVNVGLAGIFKVVRVDYVMAFQEGMKMRNGFTIGLNF